MLTVYSMGDQSIIQSVLNASAMVFNSSMFDPTQGAGVVLIGLLMGILYMIMPVMGGAKLNPLPIIFVIVLFWAGVLPRETLQIEDIYTGSIVTVANIPEVVALPASLAASLSHAITTNVETAFQTTSGSYLSMGAQGFVNPLKLLLSLRDPHQTEKVFPYLSESLTEFVKYCAPTDPNFTFAALTGNPNMVTYLTGLNVTGIMTYWSSANPNGYGTSCSQGQTNLTNDTSPGVINAIANNVLATNTAGSYPPGSTSQPNVAGLTQAYNSVTAGLMGNMQSAQGFMLNAIAMMPVKQGIDCVNQPTGPNMSDCMGNVIVREALEKQNVDAAAQASVFTQTMIPAMNILLALFYAFAPIMIAVAFMSGAHGIKIILGLFMFGAWTQTWMPIAAVINYMIQLQVQYAFSALPPAGVTMENYMQFYSVLTMKIGIASTLLSMIPMISMALLSGSVMALTSVAQGMSAKDYSDESKVAPSVGSNDAVVKNEAVLVGAPKATVGYADTTIAGSGVHAVLGDTAGNQVNSTIDLKTAASNKAANDRALANTARVTANNAQTRASGITKSAEELHSLAVNGSHGLENVENTEQSNIHDFVASMTTGKGWDQTKRKAVQEQLMLKAKTGTPGEAIFGSGLSLEASAGLSSEDAQSFKDSVAASQKEGDTNNYKSSQGAINKWGRTVAAGKQHADKIAQNDQIADQYQVGTERATAAENKASESETFEASVGGGKQYKSNEMAAQMFTTDGNNSARPHLLTQQAAERVAAADPKFNLENYNKQVETLAAKKIVGTQDEKLVAASLEVLQASGHAGSEEVLKLAQDYNLIATGGKPGLSTDAQQSYSNTFHAGNVALQGATNATANAATLAKGTRDATAAPIQVMSSGEKSNANATLTKQLNTKVQDTTAMPPSMDEEGNAAADKAGITDEWKIYKEALVAAGLMLVGGAGGKAVGKLAGKLKGMPATAKMGPHPEATHKAIGDLVKEEQAALNASEQAGAGAGAVTGDGVAMMMNNNVPVSGSGDGGVGSGGSPTNQKPPIPETAIQIAADGVPATDTTHETPAPGDPRPNIPPPKTAPAPIKSAPVQKPDAPVYMNIELGKVSPVDSTKVDDSDK